MCTQQILFFFDRFHINYKAGGEEEILTWSAGAGGDVLSG